MWTIQMSPPPLPPKIEGDTLMDDANESLPRHQPPKIEGRTLVDYSNEPLTHLHPR